MQTLSRAGGRAAPAGLAGLAGTGPDHDLVAGAGGTGAAGRSDRWLARRITVIWALLFFNGMTWLPVQTVVVLPQRWGQVLTMGALAVALLLALLLNPRLVIRPNLVLGLYTLLACVALVASIKGAGTVGPLARTARLFAFLAVLWLLTPWWGRRDMLLARCHLRVALVVLSTVVVGLLLAPGRALGTYGRLTGVVWPIWATAVAHYAAVAAGMCAVLWMAGAMRRRPALLLFAAGVVMVVLSKTRVAAVALVAGLLCAGLSLFLARRRVRRVVGIALAVTPVLLVALTPLLVSWFSRGQSADEIAGLTGRKRVWEMLLNAPRSEFAQWFGHGLSDKGFNGLAIDNTWYAAYQDEGLIGVGLVALVLIVLLVKSVLQRPSPARAVALFLLVYCAVDSYTEVGLADASAYLLELMAAASLLTRAPPGNAGTPGRLVGRTGDAVPGAGAGAGGAVGG